MLQAARLSPRYADKHGAHIGMTNKFLGYLRGVTKRAYDDPANGVTELKASASLLERFDTYFLVHLGLRDSQEPWIKRWFWKRVTAKEYHQQATQVMAAMEIPAGLNPPEDTEEV